jgi:hypothetical protein
MSEPDYAGMFRDFTDELDRIDREAKREPGVVLRCFIDVKPVPLRWLWPDRIPLGKLTLIIGDPGLGKSLLTVDIASRITRATPFPDGAICEPGSAIFLSAEDDVADTIRPRLDAAGTDVSRVYTIDAVRVQLTDGSFTEKAFNLETDCAALEVAIREHPDVRLIVIDPISAYLGGVDSHSNAEVRGLLTPLASLAAKYNVAVVAVTHLRKSAGAAVYRAIASIAFMAAARAVWAVAADAEDQSRRLLLAVKSNLAAEVGGLAYRIEGSGGAPRLLWEEGAVNLSANDVLATIDMGEGRSERKEAKEWLREYLGDGQAPAEEVERAARRVGISHTTLWRAAESLGMKRRKLGGRGAGWEWSLDEDSKFKDSTSSVSDVESLESLNNPLKTKRDTQSEISKIPPTTYMESLKKPPPEGKKEYVDPFVKRVPPGAEYIPDSEGPGVTCRACATWFGSVGSWRYHVVGKRCDGVGR